MMRLLGIHSTLVHMIVSEQMTTIIKNKVKCRNMLGTILNKCVGDKMREFPSNLSGHPKSEVDNGQGHIQM